MKSRPVSLPARALAIAAGLSAGMALSGCGGARTTTASPAPTPAPTPNPAPASACTTPNVTITHSPTATNATRVIFLDSNVYPQAVCNDGSSAAYVLRPGSGSAASRWVISLQGGSECSDQATCSARAANSPQLISTNPYRNMALQLSGIQGSDPSTNPDFYDATQVLALYCSSDDWSGAKVGGGFNSGDVTTWNFQGHAILAAIVADLKANQGLTNASEVLLTGESAGGVGVFANVNAVAKLVPATARFVASQDAGFGNVVDNFSANGTAPDYTSNTTPAEIALREVAIALWNGTGDAACAATATDSAAQVGCYSGAELLAPGGTISFPMLLTESLKDTNQLVRDGIPQNAVNSASFNSSEAGYVHYFADTMGGNLLGTTTNVSIFAPDALIHTEANDSTLFNTPYTFPSGTFTLQHVEGSWYQSPCTAQREVAVVNP